VRAAPLRVMNESSAVVFPHRVAVWSLSRSLPSGHRSTPCVRVVLRPSAPSRRRERGPRVPPIRRTAGTRTAGHHAPATVDSLDAAEAGAGKPTAEVAPDQPTRCSNTSGARSSCGRPAQRPPAPAAVVCSSASRLVVGPLSNGHRHSARATLADQGAGSVANP